MMRSPNANDSIYYHDAGRIGLVRRISLHARLHDFRLFLREMQPGPASSILDLGVSLDVGNMEANVLEQFYPLLGLAVLVGALIDRNFAQAKTPVR